MKKNMDTRYSKKAAKREEAPLTPEEEAMEDTPFGKVDGGDGGKEKEHHSYGDLKHEDYYLNGKIYSYDFLTSQEDMRSVALPDIDTIREDGRVKNSLVIQMGMENTEEEGFIRNGQHFVKNRYTGREYRIDTAGIRHGLNGDKKEG